MAQPRWWPHELAVRSPGDDGIRVRLPYQRVTVAQVWPLSRRDGQPSHSNVPMIRCFGSFRTLTEVYGLPFIDVLFQTDGRHLQGGASFGGAATGLQRPGTRFSLCFALRGRTKALHSLISAGSAALSRFGHCRPRGIRSRCLSLWMLV